MRTGIYYKLEGHTAMPCEDVLDWAVWYETTERHVNDTRIWVPFSKVRISTVFLGIDHGLDEEEPVLFETMIFGGRQDGYCERYCTWEEAEMGHKRVVRKCKQWWNFWQLWNV